MVLEKGELTMDYKFKCPYCFNEINHTDVLFRGSTIFRPDEFDKSGQGRTRSEIEIIPDESLRKELLAEYDNREYFSPRQDEIYYNWYKSVGFGATWENPGKDEIAGYDRPIIRPKDHGTSDLFYDNDGFAFELRDSWGTPTKDRVCPHCHNLLPKGYGKYSVRNICFVGATGVGKTVYLSQLFDHLSYYLEHFGLTSTPSKEMNQFLLHNKVLAGNPLPAGTCPNRVEQPLFVKVNDRKGKTEMLNFYCISGENCINLSHSYFKNVIGNANGIILLIDPIELTANANYTEQILSELILTLDRNNSIDIPIAVCVSKSDELKGIIPDICFEEVKNKNKVFCSHDYNIISQEICELFERVYPSLDKRLCVYFDKYNYFAISSLGENCKIVSDDDYEYPIITSESNPIRIEEPLGWMLKEFGFIESDGAIYVPKNKEIINSRNEILKEVTQLQAELADYPKICFGNKAKQKRDLLIKINDLQEKITILDQRIEKYAQ